MFRNPCVLVTLYETSRQVLMHDQRFMSGWPKATNDLGSISYLSISHEEHKRLRRPTASPISGQKALAIYHKYIKEVINTSLDEWASREGPVEFLNEIRKITFKIIMYIFMSGESGLMLETMEKLYADLNQGMRAMAINLPGFADHKALTARKTLIKILQDVLDGRRARKKKGAFETNNDLMDLLVEVEDDNGVKLDDEEITNIILMYLNAGHEALAHGIIWATIFLNEHPEYFQKAKEEQEQIIKCRTPTETELSTSEIKQMDFLAKAIKETLRIANISAINFREPSIVGHWWLERINPRCQLRYLPHIRPKGNCFAKIKELPSPCT